MLRKGLGGALAVALIMAVGPALAQGTRVALTFTPESKTPAFEAAAAETDRSGRLKAFESLRRWNASPR